MAATRALLLALALAGAGGGPWGRAGATASAEGPGPAPPAAGAGDPPRPPRHRQDPPRGLPPAPPPPTSAAARWGRPSPRGGPGSPPQPLPGGGATATGGTPGGTPRAGGGNGSRPGEAELGVRPPGGVWPAPWGWGGPVGAMAVAYVALGGAVLVGLCHRHRALQSRKRQRRLRESAQRFFRVTPPGPHSPYGNVLCPTAAPRPPPELSSPTAGPPGGLWGQAPAGAREEEEEEEEEEGYEHPDSETEGPGEGYENDPRPPGPRSSVGSYENELEAAGEPWGAAASHYANAHPAPGSRLRLQRALLGAGERLDGRSEGSAGSQPYEEMAGEGLCAAARRGGGLGPEDDAGSYENMEGTRGDPGGALG